MEAFERCRQFDLLQHLTLLEGTFFNHVDVVHKGDAAYLLAVMERAHADTESRERDVDLLQRQTSVECFVTDGVDTVRQVDAVEPRAALEGLLGQRVDAVRDDYLTQSRAACKHLIAHEVEGGGQFDSLYVGTAGEDPCVQTA